MTLSTIDTRHWHARFKALEAISEEEMKRTGYVSGADTPATNALDAVEAAWNAVGDTFKAKGFRYACDDKAEEVVAAITRYLFASNPGNGVLMHLSLLVDAKLVR